MKKEKITITILSIIIVLLTSYIIYDYITIHNLKETEQKDETNNNESTNNNNNSENTNESTNNQENIANENEIDEEYQKILSKFAGKYQYGTAIDQNICNTDEPNEHRGYGFQILTLNNNETFTYSYGTNCGSGYYIEGKYIINKNIIYLINNKCHIALNENNEFFLPNCGNLITLKFTHENDTIRIFEDTPNIYGEYTELKKVN